MTDFVEEFRNIAQMVTIINHNHMYPVVETFGYADHLMNSWKLDPHTLKYNFKGNLPYDIEIVEPQPHLVRYVLDQPYSKEMIAVMLNLQKQVKISLHTMVRVIRGEENKQSLISLKILCSLLLRFSFRLLF